MAFFEFDQRRNNIESRVALILENLTCSIHIDVFAAPLHHARLQGSEIPMRGLATLENHGVRDNDQWALVMLTTSLQQVVLAP